MVLRCSRRRRVVQELDPNPDNLDRMGSVNTIEREISETNMILYKNYACAA